MPDDESVSDQSPQTQTSLKNEIARGTRTVIITQVIGQLVSLGALAILYRLISQQDFGILGMVVPVMMLLRILATQGLNVATVQESEISEGQLSTLFWCNLTVASIAGIATAAAGPLSAKLFQTSQVTAVAMALGGTAVVAGLGSQHQALLERHMQLSRLAVVRFIALMIASLVAVILAWLKWGIWALVVQQYVELVLLAILAWTIHPWKPRLPWRGEGVGRLLKFGGYYSMSNIMFYLSRNTDKWLLSFFLGGTPDGRAILGMYTQAFNQMMKPVFLVTTPIAGVMLPGLARVKDHRDSFVEIATQFYRFVAIILFPVSVGLFFVAEELFVVLGGEPWRFSGVMLQAMSLTILGQGLVNISGSLYASKGRADQLFWASVATAVVMTVGHVAGFYWGQTWFDRFDQPLKAGVLGVCWAYSAVSLLLISLPYLWLCFRRAGVPIRPVAAGAIGSLLASLAMGFGVWAFQTWLAPTLALSPLLELVLSVALGIVLYCSLGLLEIRWAIRFLKDR